MKKSFLLLSLTCSLTLSLNAQDIPVGPNWCGHGENLSPSERVQDEIDQAEFQVYYEDFLQDWSPNHRSLYVIPVVVHVVHINEAENISDEQIYSALTLLNEDYSAMNPGQSNVVPAFAPIIGDAQIEFRLATKDPNGNCHSGITRTYSATTYDDGSGQIEQAVENEHGTWPQNRYLNIFVCKDPNGNAGYTNYPSSWYSQTSMDGGIKIRHDYFGSIGTSNPSSGHVISHEVGHWLNLPHCWGSSNEPGLSSNCGMDDGVADTPLTIGWTGCFTSGETCGSLDNVQNYMEYSGCRYMFTNGQCARMHAALNSSTAGRNNLWTASNLAATGTDGPGELCEANFSSGVRMICAGETVDFYDDSYHNITGRTWTFNGGTPGTSSVENPVITYNTPGVYSVTLNVTDGSSNVTVTETDYVIVLANPGIENHVYYEGFETLSAVPDNQKFMVENFDEISAWEIFNGTGSSGSHCVWLYNYGVDNGSMDELVSGTIDLSALDPSEDLVFKFDFAYRRRNSSNDESLKFYISKDCGQTWALRKNLSGNSLGTTNLSSTSYLPTAGGWDWQTIYITNINSDYYVQNFRYKFVFENDGGNNIYIDEINLYPESMTSIQEDGLTGDLEVYPNPTGSDLGLTVELTNGGNYQIVMHNAIGEQVMVLFDGELQSGTTLIQENVSVLSPGIYTISLLGEGLNEVIKFVKQ